MASVQRPTYTQAVPATATIADEGGKQFAFWVDRLGKSVRAEVVAVGRCRRTVPGKWVGVYRDARGKQCKTRTFTNRATAMEAALQIEKHGREVRDGTRPATVPRGPVHLKDFIGEYAEHLKCRAVSSKNAKHVSALLARVIRDAGLGAAVAVNCESVGRWLERERARCGLSARWLIGATGRLRSYGRWLVRSGKLAANPFEGLTTRGGDLVHIRRAITVGELGQLIDAARNGEPCRRLSGEGRAALYTLAAYTGLRVGALRQLRRESFVWHEGAVIAVVSEARAQKNRRAHTVPLAPSAAEHIAEWLAGVEPGDLVFPGMWHCRSSEMLQTDLAAAGIPYRDAAGHAFDFHALRLQFGAMLALSGVPLVAAQQLLDHSTPTLTANIYSRLGVQLAPEVLKLPSLSLGTSLGTSGGESREKGRKVGKGEGPTEKPEPRKKPRK